MEENRDNHVLKPGSNCWRMEQARRVAFLVDGEDYFRAVREAILQARHSVFILGWDIHSRLVLVRDEDDDGQPRELGTLLDTVAREHGVEVHVLSWDFAMIYAIEREAVPLFVLNWKSDARVHFHMDDKHPLGASRHQKVVVVDDAVAFCGGFDLSQWRWDTSQHRIDEPRRIDPDGEPYPPFHDVQMLVDGDAAAALGELARARWKRVSGSAPGVGAVAPDQDPWPASIDPVIRDTQVAIARTEAAYEGEEEIREVERLYLDSIAAAERFIYIENQYLTAHCIREALVERMRDGDALEVVIVMPEKTGGWLEQHTMDVLRSRLVRQLDEVSDGKQLRLYYPRLSADSDTTLMVHAKVMVVDDRLVRVASSNLSNRSMGLDGECDLVIEAEAGSDTQTAIRQFRERLLAEHLGVSEAAVADAMEAQGSLIAAIEHLRGGDRSLQPLTTEVDEDVDQMVPDSALLDPERPIDSHRFIEHFVPEEHKSHTFRRVLVAVATLAVLLGLAAAWRWTDLGDALDVNTLVGYAGALNTHPGAPLLVIAGFTLAVVLMVPLTLLVVAVVLGFGPWLGLVYALAGAELGALLGYFIGQGVGRDLVRRHAGEWVNNVSKRLSNRGLLTIITLRIVPVAPFAVINLVAGASHIRLRDFALGSLLGLLPGVFAIALFADGLIRAIRAPDKGTFAWLAVAVVVALGLLLGVRRWLRTTTSEKESV
ncbi:MAG: VTT domain-containing protein [Gammaproteobacteria bacterium]|nr:VTT domain-containing protein [Gammaproteobacteria bacterium]